MFKRINYVVYEPNIYGFRKSPNPTFQLFIKDIVTYSLLLILLHLVLALLFNLFKVPLTLTIDVIDIGLLGVLALFTIKHYLLLKLGLFDLSLNLVLSLSRLL